MAPYFVSDRLSELTNSDRIVLACLSGQRALVAAQMLIDNGYKSIAVIIPGD